MPPPLWTSALKKEHTLSCPLSNNTKEKPLSAEYLNHPLAVAQGKQSKLKINVSHMYIHTHKRMLASPGIKSSCTHPSLQKATKKSGNARTTSKNYENNLLDKDKCSFSDSSCLINPMRETRQKDEGEILNWLLLLIGKKTKEKM